jgi:hypothetical protein
MAGSRQARVTTTVQTGDDNLSSQKAARARGWAAAGLLLGAAGLRACSACEVRSSRLTKVVARAVVKQDA